jgi:probable rRNA maturation factor
LTTKGPALRITFAIPRTGTRHVPFLRRHLLAAHDMLRPPLRELSVALVGDRRMAALHEQFLGIPGPTDVLTFPMDEDDRGRATAGEVVVCVPEARRQAKRNGVGVERELLLYALHGMLHLCGYDDRTAAAFRTMHATEDRILTQLGVGPVFKHGPSSAPAASAPPRAGTRRKASPKTRRKTHRATGAH